MKTQQSTIALAILLSSSLLLPTIVVDGRQQAASQDNQDEVIRIRTELVQVRAVVTDRKGQVVDNLSQDDFEVLENAKLQAISFFSVERVGTVSDSKVISTQPTPTGERTLPTSSAASVQRTIVLFVDTLHTSNATLIRAKRQLKQFVDDQLTDADLVAVVTTSESLGILQQFMRDRKMLKYAIDKISPFQKRETFFTPYLAAKVLNEDDEAIRVAIQIISAEEGGLLASRQDAEARAGEILAQESDLRKATLQSLKTVGERLAEMKGQRIIALVSEGFSLLDSGGGAEREDFSAATGLAARSGVVIYSFDPKGLTAPTEYSAASPLTGIEFGNYMSQSHTDQQMTLREVADATGGEAYLNTNSLNSSFQKMLDRNRVYYSIAYRPENSNENKKFRRITVRLKNHPDYVVRTQKGYLSVEQKTTTVAATPQQTLFQAMLSPLPLTAIAVNSSAEFLEREGDEAQATLQVHFDGSSLQYPKEDGNNLLNVEIAVAVFGNQGTIANSFTESIKTTLTPAQLELAKRNGYRYSKRLSLKPGLYQVRVGVRELGSGLTGTAMSWIEVPDLHTGKLAMSSIFVGKEVKNEAEAVAVTGSGKQIPKAKLIFGRISIKRGEILFYRFVVYNTAATAQPNASVSFKLDVLQGETSVYDGDWQPLNAREIRRDSKGVEAGGQLKLSLDSGFYTLRVTVKDDKSKKIVRGMVDFDVQT